MATLRQFALPVFLAVFAIAGAVFGFLSCPYSPVSKFMEGFLP